GLVRDLLSKLMESPRVMSSSLFLSNLRSFSYPLEIFKANCCCVFFGRICNGLGNIVIHPCLKSPLSAPQPFQKSAQAAISALGLPLLCLLPLQRGSHFGESVASFPQLLAVPFLTQRGDGYSLDSKIDSKITALIVSPRTLFNFNLNANEVVAFARLAQYG